MVRAAIRDVGVYYYIFPTYSQGKKVIYDAITNTGKKFIDYIPEELIASKNSQELKITLTNGSIIQIVGSENIDSLMGTNPKGVVYSEYALQNELAWTMIKPILLGNNGWALFISCVSPETIVLTGDGPKRIKNVSSSRKEYSDLNRPVFGLGGFHNAEQFYYGGKQKTLKITLASGYKLECTPIHPIWNGKDWVKSKDLKEGDLIPIQYGQNVWGPGLDISDFHYDRHGHSKPFPFDVTSEDFFYLLGLMHADGNYDVNKVCITKKKDTEIIEFLHSYGFKTRPDGIHHEYSSKELCALLEWMDFKHGAKNKTFPESIISGTKQEVRSFLQGLFDGDGCSASNPSKRGYVKFSSSCEEFIGDLQIVLLNFGIVSSVRFEDREPQGRIKVHCRIFNLEITGYFAHAFYREIGFRLERKQKNLAKVPSKLAEESGNIYPVDLSKLGGYKLQVTNPERITRRLIRALNKVTPHPYLQDLLKEKLFYSPIKDISYSESDVFDFVIPETNSFFSNGFISHNTPRGKNHMYTMYEMALHSKDWFVYKLSVEDTHHISMADIEQERREGTMSDDLIQQEFYCSFTIGIEGSYYARYIDRMRLKGQIGNVPWESAFKVNVAIDIGVRDSTSLIFYQVVGMTVRIIDCYEKSKEGLEHYVNVIRSKPYQYGVFIAPHDIAVKEWGSGQTRVEKARQLGIDFTMANNVSIEDGIESVRSAFSKIWIDETNCSQLIKSLENYRQEYDNKRKVYSLRPLHDWSSHFCDAMRYLCVSLSKTSDGLSAEDLDREFRMARYGDQVDTSSPYYDPRGY